MASPGGREVGKVSIRVVPNTSDFGVDLKAQLLALQQTLKVIVGSDVDTSGIDEGLAAIETAAEAASKSTTVDINTSVDTTGFDEGVTRLKAVAAEGAEMKVQTALDPASVLAAEAEAQALASASPIVVSMEADNDLFVKGLQSDLDRLHKAITFKIPARPEGEQFRVEMAAIVHEANEQLKVEIPANLEGAVRVRQQMIDAVASVQAVANRLGVDLPLHTPLNQAELAQQFAIAQGLASANPIEEEVRPKLDAPFVARISADLNRILTTGERSIPVTVDREHLRTQFESMIANLERTLTLPIPPSIDIAEFRRQVVLAVERIREFARAHGLEIPANLSIDVAKIGTTAEEIELAFSHAQATIEVKARTQLDQLFVQRIKSDIAQELANVEGKIKVGPDFTLWRQKLGTLLTKFDEKITAPIPVDLAEAEKFRTDVEKLALDVKNHIKALHEEVEVAVTARVDPQMVSRVESDLNVLEKSLELHVPATIEGQQLLVEMRERIAELRAFAKLPVDLDVEGAAEAKAKVIETMSVIAAVAKKLDPTLHINTDVDMKGALAGEAELELLTKHVFHQKITADVDTNFAERLLTGFGRKVGTLLTDVIGLRLSALGQLGTQLILISSRALAYALLLAPPILIAAAGALTLAGAFVTLIPAVGAVVGGFAVVALAMKNLKADPVFTPIITQVQTLRGQLAALITANLDPLISKFSTEFMPVLSRGLQEIAVAVNFTAQQFLGFLTSARSVASTTVIFQGLSRVMTILGTAIAPLLDALQQITIAALPGFQMLAIAVVHGAEGLDRMVQSGVKSHQLQATISHAVRDLIDFSRAVGHIGVQLFVLLQDLEPVSRAVFGTIGGLLSSLIATVDNVVKTLSAGPHQGLTDLINVIEAILTSAKILGGALIDAFKPLFTNEQPGVLSHLSEILINLIKLATAFGKALLEGLGGFLGALDQILSPLDFLVRGLDDLTGFLVKIAPLIITFAAVITAVMLPALARWFVNLDRIIKFRISALPFTVPLGAVLRLTKNIIGLGAAFVRAGVEYAAYKIGLSAVNVATVTADIAVRQLGTSLEALKAKFAQAAAAALSFETIATLGVAAVIAALVRTFQRFNETADGSDEQLQKLTEHFDASDFQKGQVQIDGVANAMKDWADKAHDAATQQNFFQKAWHHFVGGDDAAVFAKTADTFGKKLEEMNTARINWLKNAQTIAAQLHVTTADIIQFAKDNDIDLSGPWKEASKSVGDFEQIIDSADTGIGLSIAQIDKNVDNGKVAWQQYADAVKQAMDAASQAFLRDVSITNFDPTKGVDELATAQKELRDAENSRADSARRLSQEQVRQHNLTPQQKQDSFALVNAQDNLKDATNRVTEAKQNLAKAKLGARDSNLANFLTDEKQQAQTFLDDMNTLIKDGLDPGIISQLLQAGPKQALPIMKALLAGHAANNIKLANDTEATMKKINAAIVEDARLTNIAVNSKNDKLAKDLPDAQKIDQLEIAHHGQLTLEQLIQALHLKPKDIAHIAQVADEFGISVKDHVAGELKTNPPFLTPGVDNLWVGTLFDDLTSTQDILNANPLRIPVTSQDPKTGKWLPWDQIKGINTPPLRDPNAPGSKRIHVATGGLIQGPGGPTQDLVPAMLSNLEFVQRAAAVRYYGVDLMHMINALMIPRTTLRMASGLDMKMAASQPSLPRSVVHSGVAKVGAEDHEHSFPGGTMVLVDADGNLIGRMRAAAINSHRDRAQASRMANLGTWGRS